MQFRVLWNFRLHEQCCVARIDPDCQPVDDHFPHMRVDDFGVFIVFVNCVLLLVNLIPIPPLDGGRILTGVLPGLWPI